MSKRFGRNQKRALKARIAELETDNERWQHRYDVLQELGERNRRIVNDTALVLGDHFLTLDPKTVELKHIDQLAYGWRVGVQKGPLPWSWNPESHVSTDQFLEVALPILHGSVIADQLQHRMHFRLTYNGHAVGYAMDESAFQKAPRDLVIRNVSAAMAEQLVSTYGYQSAGKVARA